MHDGEPMREQRNTVERIKAEVLGELHLMTPADLRAYWNQVTWSKPNLVELAKIESSPLATALGQIPPDILARASAELDPFGWLLGAVDVKQWSTFCRTCHVPWATRVWLAAASQSRAEHRLLDRAHGWSDTWRKLRQSQRSPENLRHADNHYIAQLSHATGRRRSELLTLPGVEERLRKAHQESDEAFLRRFRRAKRAVVPAGVAKAEKYAVQHWLEMPHGLPGLCFFSDGALHSLFEAFGLATGGGLATKQVRARLGLIQSGARRHLVEDVISLGLRLRFTGSLMTKPYTIEGTVSWGGRRLWPKPR